MASPPTRADPSSRYDVFLSFRGEDTRYGFTDYLFHALNYQGILTFRDSDDAERGAELKHEIESAIKTSDTSIIVFSKNYANSTWCLDELSLILEKRRQNNNHFVLAIFYHVEPSDVGKQRGSFMIQADTSKPRWTDDNVNRWKASLTEVVTVVGMTLDANRYEAEFLKKVVNEIHRRVNRKQISLPINLKGMDARSKEINSWLKEPESQFMVISGIGGSGRSTLANYIVFNNMENFENISIVEHIGSKCKAQQDMVKLQEQVCIDIAKGKDRRIPSVCQGTPQIEVLFEKRKALIVLDGISKESQLEALIGSGNINKDSKIIIIVDNDISNWFTLYSKGYKKYQTKLLNDDESTELLCNIAFRSNFPMDGFEDLVKRVVRYCDGIPCALRVLGSSLSKQNSIEYWESVLKLFGKDFNGDIRKVLRISYDLLPLETEKELLLHIACFFVDKDKDYVEKILEPDYSAISGMLNLINSCLLSISPNNTLTMNRLLQEMVRNFVVMESPILSERSRHWTNKDAYDMLRRGKCSEKMTGLTIDMNKLKKEDEFKGKQLKELTTKSLQNSDKLRLLQLDFVKMMGSCKDWSTVLRWLSWLGFLESTIPSDLDMGGLVALDMSYSFLKVFDPPEVLELLKIVNFSGSRNLFEIRNIDRIPNLETFILRNCEHLTHVCETIQHHKRLTTLDMTGCVNLCKMEHIRRAVPWILRALYNN